MDKVKEAIFRSIGYWGGVYDSDGKPHLSPWPAQREMHESGARFKALFAGSRYGKSKSGAMDVLPDVLKANTRGWIVGPTYEQPSKEFRYIYEALVVNLGFVPKRKLNVEYTSPGPQILIMPWGAEIYTKSQENTESLLSEELDWLILSEASRLNEKIFDGYLRARLGTRRGRVVIPTTPHGYNWVYKRFYLPAVDGNKDNWSKIVSVTENPLFSREEYEAAKKELPEDIFKEQYDGEFVAQTGLIYKRFLRQVNVIDPFEIPRRWSRYCAIDPHPSTPCAVIWMALDEHGTCYIYDEMFIPDLTIPEIVEKMKVKEVLEMSGSREERPRINESEKDWGVQSITEHMTGGMRRPPSINSWNPGHIKKRLIDPRAKYIDKLRGQTTSVQNQFRKSGINCIEANSKFESGFYKINELLTPKEVYGDITNKKPRLFVFKNCKETIFEFETCNWENEDKDNHLLDGLKYIMNDSPSKTSTFREKYERDMEDRKRRESMNKVTGY